MKRITLHHDMRLGLQALVFTMLFLFAFASTLWAQEIEWIRQFGSAGPPAYDAAQTVDADGNVYVAGYTDGTLPGQTGSGSQDAFVRKYDADGNELWTRQFGTPNDDRTYGISADTSGVYVTGGTSGTLPGQTSSGNWDAFVRKYDADGNELWTRQFGTSGTDWVLGISSDSSGVYLAGNTTGIFPGQTSSSGFDAFVRKYDADGNELWTTQFSASPHDRAFDISVDSSGVYVAGLTYGTLPGQTSSGGYDAFVRKYDTNGNEVWTRQFGTPGNDHALDISSDSSGVYVAGHTTGTLPVRQAQVGMMRLYVSTMPTVMNSGQNSSELQAMTMLVASVSTQVACMWLGTHTVPCQVSQAQVLWMRLYVSTTLTVMNYGQHSSELQAMTWLKAYLST